MRAPQLDWRNEILMTQDPASTPVPFPRPAAGWDKVNVGLVVWVLAIVLLWWVLRSVSLTDVWAILGHLSGWQVLTLLALNLIIAFTFGWRWWLILRAQGYSIPYPLLASYRLVSYSISYFTPGPHLGGEPLQVYLLRQRHAVPVASAAASVALEKLLEVLVNFTFLLAGVIITLQARVVPEIIGPEAMAIATCLLAAPLGFLWTLYAGHHLISGLLARIPIRVRSSEKMVAFIRETEDHAIQSCREHPRAVLLALCGSVLVWWALLFEYWLATQFLGLNLTFVQLISVVTAARVAILLPSPGGLGTLEAGQVWMMGWLGLDPAAGLGLSLLIRARDLLFGIIGLCWGAWLIGGWHFLWGKRVSE
jgi:uncharacterized protein (TIRG00374 family)